MIANPKKLRAIVLAKEKQNIDSFQINISGKTIFPTDSVDVLGITIDNRLNFEKYISSLCEKAAGQLNALKRVGDYVPQNSWKISADAFNFSKFQLLPSHMAFFNSKTTSKN